MIALMSRDEKWLDSYRFRRQDPVLVAGLLPVGPDAPVVQELLPFVHPDDGVRISHVDHEKHPVPFTPLDRFEFDDLGAVQRFDRARPVRPEQQGAVRAHAVRDAPRLFPGAADEHAPPPEHVPALPVRVDRGEPPGQEFPVPAREGVEEPGQDLDPRKRAARADPQGRRLPAEFGGDLVLGEVHVDPDADHDVPDAVRPGRRLHQDPGRLPLPEVQVVGPLEETRERPRFPSRPPGRRPPPGRAPAASHSVFRDARAGKRTRFCPAARPIAGRGGRGPRFDRPPRRPSRAGRPPKPAPSPCCSCCPSRRDRPRRPTGRREQAFPEAPQR